MPSHTDDPPRAERQITDVPAARSAASPAVSPALPTTDDHALTEESFRAILSSQQRAGRWEPADEIQVRAIFGAVTLDFTRAELPPSGTIEIDAVAFGGAVEIIVPDGAEVELEGTPILGSIEQKVRSKGAREGIREWITGEREGDVGAPDPPREAPYFRIDCRVIMGSIEVTGR